MIQKLRHGLLLGTGDELRFDKLKVNSISSAGGWRCIYQENKAIMQLK